MGLPFVKFHYCEIVIQENYIYRLLNNSGEIELRNIRTTDKKTKINILYSDREKILELLKRLNIELLSCEERGIYTIITRFPVVKTTIAVLMIFSLFLMVNSLFIWKISVDGNYSYSENQIVSFIHSLKISEGIPKGNINAEQIEKAVRNQFDDISWVCAEVKGTNLIIHMKENYMTEISAQEDQPYDIISNKDAEIVSVLVRSGKSDIKVGDKVKKGDILIHGVVDVLDESGQKLFSKYCNSDGDIVGKTVYNYREELNITYEKKIEKKRKTYYLPSVSGYQWELFQKKKNRDVIYSEMQLKGFGNFYLPLLLQKYHVIYYDIKKEKYSKKQAETILNRNLFYKLSVMEQKGYKILEKNVKIEKEKNSYIISGEIVCLEPLGAVSYIDINKLQEETTQIHERS